jgi:ParB-like chromosome segregation protein Spo0J
MAVIWNEAAGVDRTANGGYTVLPKNVVLKPEFSGRSEETDVSELAEDIKHNKQIVPALCYKDEDGWPVLIAGHRRLRAISLINEGLPEEDQLRLKFNYEKVKSEEEALDITVAENRNRTDINPLDDSYNISVYMTKFGKGIEEIALKYFPGAKDEKLKSAIIWVRERQRLLELSPEAQERLRNGEFSTSAALQLAKLQPTEQNRAIQNAEKSGKKLKVKDAIAAKRAETNPTPAKLLKKLKILAEVAGALAAEDMAKEFHRSRDPEMIKEFAPQLLVMCYKLGIALEPHSQKWAEENKSLQTAFDGV